MNKNLLGKKTKKKWAFEQTSSMDLLKSKILMLDVWFQCIDLGSPAAPLSCGDIFIFQVQPFGEQELALRATLKWFEENAHVAQGNSAQRPNCVPCSCNI